MCGITEALLIPNLERGTYLIIPDAGEHQKVFYKFQDIFNKAWDIYSDKLWIKCKKENLVTIKNGITTIIKEPDA